MVEQKQIDVAECDAYNTFMIDAKLAGLQQECWIFFMRDIVNGASVYAAIRYARREWDI